MNHLLATIHWNPNPELFNLLGISIRYYGLLWAVGILFAYLVVHYQYRDKKIGEDKFEPLFFYCFFGIVLGARLGHCLFGARYRRAEMRNGSTHLLWLRHQSQHRLEENAWF